MEEDFLSWSMDEIGMKQKLGKEIKVVTGDEEIQRTPKKCPSMLKVELPSEKIE